MRRIISVGFACLAVCCLQQHLWAESMAMREDGLIRQLSDGDTIRVYNSVSVNNISSSMKNLAVLLPYPESNAYQEVLAHVYGSAYGDGGKVRNTNDQRKYLRFLFTRNQMAGTDNVSVHDTFDIIYKEVSVDFSSVDTTLGYDTLSYDYLNHIDGDGAYIHPTHPYIDSVALMIWEASSKTVLDYA
ncbi:MAG: hypothetical protein J5792_07725, partial [Bacteroidales bacterium]|nr:hypothetical protein [Bacteroidales bacterium]